MLADPTDLAGTVSRGDSSRPRRTVQTRRETQHFLLLHRRESADPLENGFFQTHDICFIIALPPGHESARSGSGVKKIAPGE
jgi:hypothetical protein